MKGLKLKIVIIISAVIVAAVAGIAIVSNNSGSNSGDQASASDYNSGSSGGDNEDSSDYSGSSSGHTHQFRVNPASMYLKTAATCTSKAEYYYSCSCGAKSSETFTLGYAPHTEVVDKAVAATATKNGLTEGKHCSVCNEVLVEQEVVYATGSVGLLFEGNVCVGTGTCTDDEIAIPRYSPEGELVTAIGDRAFEGCTASAIIIPDSIVSIGTRAFYNCPNITEMHIPSSVTSIGTQIFYKASNLNTVYYDSYYYNENNVFLDTDSITKIVFGGKRVIAGVLKDCTNIKEVEIADSVTTIDEWAFKDCSSITKVKIGRGVATIPVGSFKGCSGIKSVELSYGVTFIDRAFWSCTNLTDIKIPESVTVLAEAFLNCTSLANVEIPDSVTSIDGAFSGCANLTSIEIPDSVTSIDGAFSGCANLTSIEIPDSVTSIDGAFAWCVNLTSIEIPESITSIGFATFGGCTGLTSITIPRRVKEIKETAFLGCSNLKSITIPASLTLIENRAFKDCVELVDFYINDLRAWCNISGLANLTGYSINSKNKKLYLNNELMTNLFIPDSVSLISGYAFYNCKDIESITISDNVTKIQSWAFFGSGAKSITYNGTKEQWKAIKKGSDLLKGDYVIHCSDGDITVSRN